MGRYSYTLYKKNEDRKVEKNTYKYSQLEKMTTFQLREICTKEKLAKSIIDPLNKEELIRLIIRFRGRPETLNIHSYEEKGLDRIDMFLKSTKIIEKSDKNISFPAKLVVYEDADMDFLDGYTINCNEELSEGNMLLTDENYEVKAVFQIKIGAEGIYYLARGKEHQIREIIRKQHIMLYLDKNESDIIYNIYYGKTLPSPYQFNVYRMPVAELKIENIKDTENPLVIDFGTSSTTAGTFGEHQEIKIANNLNEKMEKTPLFPSVIGIKSIGEDIEYVYGYDAINMTKNSYMDEEVPVFFDIKRWVNDINRKEKVMTPDGTHAWIERGEMLKNYLMYIVNYCQSRFKLKFKKIILLAPVRQKGKFGQAFKEMLNDYQVECSLNEGAAVIFENVYKLLDTRSYEKNLWYKGMIIDCGGGTTDLTSCQFKINNSNVSYKIDMECSYETGDTNFGGNNLTYRIMQLLKIRIAEVIKGEKLFVMKDAIGLRMGNYRDVDDMEMEAYKELEEAYIKAEKIIPTQFKTYEDKSAVEYFKVKNNYYYLFDTAERIKELFFEDSQTYMVRGVWELEKCISEENNKSIHIDRWKLAVVNEGIFIIKEKPNEEIKFCLHEIQGLLSPEIYMIMKKFLERSHESGDLSDYRVIRLTGQSCKAVMFYDAIKEFIAGRYMDNANSRRDAKDLKMCCIRGALMYYKIRKKGYMEINHIYETGAAPYEVMAHTHENREKTLISPLNKNREPGHISRFKEGEVLNLYLRDKEGKELRRYTYEYKIEDMEAIKNEQLSEKYNGKIRQEETDNITNGETKFFVWPSEEEWGFYVLPVIREKDILYIGKHMFCDFEDDTWEINFFDGMK